MPPVAIIQARMGSSRLPGKVLLPILGRPMLWHIVQRLRHVPGLSRVVVATSDTAGDAPVRSMCQDYGIDAVAGSENDVLDRFYQAATWSGADPVIRITGDCPFVDPDIVGRLLALYKQSQFDHVGVATGAGALHLQGGRFPDGLDAECLSFAALAQAWRDATHPLDREHVTPYIWRNTGRFRTAPLMADKDYSTLRWTVDNQADFELVVQVYTALYRPDRPFLMQDIMSYLAAHPELAAANRGFIGQEGYNKLWQVGRDPETGGKAGEKR